jgi:hypothetical protein
MKWLLLFFETLAKEGKGLLGERLSIHTLCEYLLRFRAEYNRRHEHFITEETFQVALTIW